MKNVVSILLCLLCVTSCTSTETIECGYPNTFLNIKIDMSQINGEDDHG